MYNVGLNKTIFLKGVSKFWKIKKVSDLWENLKVDNYIGDSIDVSHHFKSAVDIFS